MRYRLRTLLIVLVLGPPLLAAMWFVFTIVSGIREAERQRLYRESGNGLHQIAAEAARQ
jgi:hypothetical protein